MANYGDLGFLANLMALPVELGPQSQANYTQGAMNRRLLEGLKTFGPGGPQPMFSPEDINALAPQPAPPVSFPGLNVPVLGTALRGIGTTGRILQGALGLQPDAPRLPTELLSAVVKQQEQQRKLDFGHQVAGDIRAGKPRSEIAAEFAESGDVKGAANLMGKPRTPAVTKWTTAAGSLGLPLDPGSWTQEQWQEVSDRATAPPNTGGRYKNDLDFYQHDPAGWRKYHGEKSGLDVDTAAEKARRRQEVTSLMPTSATRTMKEAAPGVIDLANKLEADLAKVETGPLSGRYQEFATKRVGTDNPDFLTYLDRADLLVTLLSRMHTGARGSEHTIDRFDQMISAGYQSPANMRAAIGVIRDYAGAVMTLKSSEALSPPPTQTTPTAPGGTPQSGVLDDGTTWRVK